MRRLVRVASIALAATLLAAAPASAGRPQREFVPVDDLFVDEFLSDACGAEVTGHITGHIVFRVFSDAVGAPVREVNNYAMTGLYSSAYGSVRVKDVGVDRVTYSADGSIINVIVGNVQSISVPGEGRVYSDVGQTTVHITFDGEGNPTVHVLDAKGQHDPDQIGPLCSVLGS